MQKEIKFNAVDCFKQASFQRSALDALLVPLLENNPEGIALADTSVSILQSAIASMIGLIADGVENGDGVEEVRKNQIAESLRMIASLVEFVHCASDAMTDSKESQEGACR